MHCPCQALGKLFVRKKELFSMLVVADISQGGEVNRYLSGLRHCVRWIAKCFVAATRLSEMSLFEGLLRQRSCFAQGMKHSEPPQPDSVAKASQVRVCAPAVTVIGSIHSAFRERQGVPIQPGYSQAQGEVRVRAKFEECLQDIEGFQRIWLIYWFDRSPEGFAPRVVPFLDDRPHGVFATRAPNRPNAIGMSCVELLGRKGAVLSVQGVDVLDETPLLDIKPYVPRFDAFADAQAGWVDESSEGVRVADARFAKNDFQSTKPPHKL